MLEAAKIAALALVAAIAYGVAQDQLTARLSIEYFTLTHPKLVESEAPGAVGLAWGVAATWWVGAILGGVLAIAARAGARPKRDAASLVRPIAVLLAVTALGALALGATGWLGARNGVLVLREPLLSAVPAARHAHFFAAWGATGGAYAAGVLGGVVLCAAVWRARGRARAPLELELRG